VGTKKRRAENGGGRDFDEEEKKQGDQERYPKELKMDNKTDLKYSPV
jgi:hypothetical protein